VVRLAWKDVRPFQGLSIFDPKAAGGVSLRQILIMALNTRDKCCGDSCLGAATPSASRPEI
jgi:hypothetical protein